VGAVAVPLVVAALLGFTSAYRLTLGLADLGLESFNARLTAGILGFPLVVAMLTSAVVLLQRGRRTPRGPLVLAAAAILVGGAAGALAVPLLDLGYPPDVFTSRGQAVIRLENDGFEAGNVGLATCASVPDGTAVGEVDALELGRLNGAPLRATLARARTNLPWELGPWHLDLWVDGAYLPDGKGVFWAADLPPAHASGAGRASLGFKATRTIGGQGWPRELAGVIEWTCDPCTDSAPTSTVAPSGPPSAFVRLQLSSAVSDFAVSEGDGSGQCELESGGTVRIISAERAGRLLGKPLSVAIDLGTEPDNRLEAGRRVLLRLVAQVSPAHAAAPGHPMAATSGVTVQWEDRVALREVSPNGTYGRAAFQDLPSAGNTLPGLPTSLSGEVDWDCR
jgi:hypothetical protein